MKKLTLTAMLFAAVVMHAQQSPVSAGGEATGSGGSSSYTIGQIAYTTESDDNHSTLQGMQHAYEVFDVTGKTDKATFQLTAYPNPTEDLVNLKAENVGGSLSYQLFSLSGRLLESADVKESNASISMKAFAQGNYFIKIFLNGEPIKTFKIIKQ